MSVAVQSPGTIALSSGGTGSVVAGPGLANLSAAPMLSKWRTGVARVRAKTGNCRVLVIGDSTTIGSNNAGTAVTPNEYDYTAAMLTSHGIPSLQQSFMGNSQGSYRTGVDARLALGTWTNAAPSPSAMGGGFWSPGATNGAALSFATTAPVNTFRVWSAVNSGQGTLTCAITGGLGGGASVAFDSAVGTNGTLVYSNIYYVTVTTTGAAANNTLTIKLTSGTSGNVLGIEAWDSTTPSVQFINAGWSASKSSDWVGTGFSFSPLTFLQGSPYDLVIIKSMINDATGSTLAAYQANIQTLITAAVGNGADVILETDNPFSTGSAPQATQQAFVNVLYSLAAANNIVLVDHVSRWASYAVSNPLGLFTDTLHPGIVGHADLAAGLATALLSPVGR